MNISKIIMRVGEDGSAFDIYDDHGKQLKTVALPSTDEAIAAYEAIRLIENILDIKIQIKSSDEE